MLIIRFFIDVVTLFNGLYFVATLVNVTPIDVAGIYTQAQRSSILPMQC